MKALGLSTLLLLIIGSLGAADLESYEFIDALLSLGGPGEPKIFEDAVIFTAADQYKTVGIAFLHEGFAKIHPFSKLFVPVSDTDEFNEKSKTPPETLRDSGILFFVYTVPPQVKSLEYRLVFDGLWSPDPYNPRRKFNVKTGIEHSVAPLPVRPPSVRNNESPFDGVVFHYRGESGGGRVTVAGDFNGWDPFMYELKETAPGLYSLALPLPPGTWRYVYYRNGERFVDYSAAAHEYRKDGSPVNVVIVK
ncbi:MAG: isoamylase [Spirochaetaceae bacterium]|jgi:hypothetical protein|nr:isoamylase [Spirochaetaceae bacterium]